MVVSDNYRQFKLNESQNIHLRICISRSLPSRLLTLSSQTLCHHVVPLLLTPLVMREPAARQYLWKHLFTPITGKFFWPTTSNNWHIQYHHRRPTASFQSRWGVSTDNREWLSSLCPVTHHDVTGVTGGSHTTDPAGELRRLYICLYRWWHGDCHPTTGIYFLIICRKNATTVFIS